MAALTDDGSDVIQREINLVAIHPRGRRVKAATAAPGLSDDEFATRYDIVRTAAAVAKHGAGRVALQMPDALLEDATRVQRALRKAVGGGVLFFVMADTVFAPCCVDEITAEHCFADMIVKYGHSCLTATSRVPVHFVPLYFAVAAEAVSKAVAHLEAYAASLLEEDTPDCEVDEDPAAADAPPTATMVAQPLHAPLLEAVWGVIDDSHSRDEGAKPPTVEKWGVRWVRKLVGVDGKARDEGAAPESAPAPAPADDDATPAPTFSGFRVSGGRVPAASRGLVVFGDEDGVLRQAHLWGEYRRAVGGAGTVLALDLAGETNDAETYTVLKDVQKRLRVRHFASEKIKDAEVVAIVVVSLAIEGYREVVEHLKDILTANGKSHIVVYVGKPNVAKLSNYEEVDLYCVLACPQTSWLDAKEYPKPVVTPMEIATALLEYDNALMLPQYYALDLPAVIEAYPSNVPREPMPETTQMSFITGSVRADTAFAAPSVPGAEAHADGTPADTAAEGDDDANAMVAYQAREVIAFQQSALVTRMHQRNYRGLEVKKGETEVQAEVVPGLAGIASGYQSEPKTK